MSRGEAERTPPRYVVTSGGDPTPEQLAALAIALTPVAVPDGPGASSPPPEQPSAWARAAVLEGVGHRTFVAMPDLAAGRFPLG